MTFDFNAEKYEKASAHQRQWGEKLITELDLKGNERILDLGCGDGGITAHLAECVPNGLTVGIDASQSMVESAQKNYKTDNLRFALMDINTIDFVDEFDLIFSNATLHWVKDHHKLLANVRKCLKAEGILRFNFAADGNCSHFFHVIRQVMHDGKYARYFDEFEWPWYMPVVAEYKRHVTRVGFQEVKVWGENADRHFADAEEMIRWIDQPSLVPFMKCVADIDKQSFRNTVVEQMLKETSQPGGTCFETFRRINVFAKK